MEQFTTKQAVAGQRSDLTVGTMSGARLQDMVSASNTMQTTKQKESA